MVTLPELIAFLQGRLALPAHGETDVPLLWRPAATKVKVQRLGLALEFSSEIGNSAAACDALFFHRPFLFPASALPGVPVLASHLGFDAHLTTGLNPALADALGLREIHPLFRPNRPDEVIPIGMVGTLIESITFSRLQQQVSTEFGGLDEAVGLANDSRVPRLAVMNALNPTLIALAAEYGATVYLTGQMRENARVAARDRGISVIAAGHLRIEQWGLRQLSQEISQAFPDLEICLLEA